MHAAVRRLQCAPGQAEAVGQLIESEYLPQLAEVEGVISYTLVALGDDQVTSIGVFADAAGAERANTLAQSWAKDRLAGLGASPLEASDGPVLVHSAFGA